MKRGFYSVVMMLCMVFTTNKATAQSSDDFAKNQLSISVGMLTHEDLREGFEDMFSRIFVDAFTLGLSEELREYNGDTPVMPSLGVSYYRGLNKHIYVGGSAMFQLLTTDYTFKNSTATASSTGLRIAIMPSLKCYYIHKKHFGLYGRVDAGVLFRENNKLKCNNMSDNDREILRKSEDLNDKSAARMGFHVTPIGIEAGGKNFSGFLEIGYGQRGMFAAGVNIGF